MHRTERASPIYPSKIRLAMLVLVQLALLAAIIFYFTAAFKGQTTHPSPAIVAPADHHPVIDKAAIYHLYTANAITPATDFGQDAGTNGSGVIVDAWPADTDANRRACHSLWLFDRAHEHFCTALRKTMVLAVRESGTQIGRIAYLPVPFGTRVATGQTISFKRGTVGMDRDTAALPSLIEVIQE